MLLGDLLSSGPPIMAVLPSAERATLDPKVGFPMRLLPNSLPPCAPCAAQVVPLRTRTHAAPTALLSRLPPTKAVLPSLESATLTPKRLAPTVPAPVILTPCWLQALPARVKTQTEPLPAASSSPPISAVLPSGVSATLLPKWPVPASPAPVNLAPSLQVAPARVKTQTAPLLASSSGAPIRARSPSPESATLPPNL